MESMHKYRNLMTAEEAIANFIRYIEGVTGKEILPEDKDWLFLRGQEVFNLYYIDEILTIQLASQEDKVVLDTYFENVQTMMGKMFAHIMLNEYKLRVLNGNPH